MSESSSFAPGKSLESDLRLIREAKGLTREDVFNRVHIRPEVLTQVEEFGFAATPTLSSAIHRRSFVKHYADAIHIDSAVALEALVQSQEGRYDGLLARTFLVEQSPVEPPVAPEPPEEEVAPRVIDDLHETVDEAEDAVVEAPEEAPEELEEELPPNPPLDDEVTRVNIITKEIPIDEFPDAPPSDEVEEIPWPIDKPEEEAAEDADVEQVVAEEIEAEEPPELVEEPAAEVVAEEPEPEIEEAEPEPEAVVDEAAEIEEAAEDAEVEQVVAEEIEAEEPPELVEEPVEEVVAEEPEPVIEDAEPDTRATIKDKEPRDEIVGDSPEPVDETAATEEVIPESGTEETTPPIPIVDLDSPYAPPIPGVTTSETPPAPPKEEDSKSPPSRRHSSGGRRKRRKSVPPPPPVRSSSESARPAAERRESWSHVRSRHLVTWLGLLGVLIVVVLFLVRSFTEWMEKTDRHPVHVRKELTIEMLPERFTGYVRLDDNTEQFVTLVVQADSDTLAPNTFQFKMWTHSAGSLYATTGEGILSQEGSQVRLPDPYGEGGVFLSEEGEVRMRSVRRLEFPRWELTGQTQ